MKLCSARGVGIFMIFGMVLPALFGTAVADVFLMQISHNDAQTLMGREMPASTDTTRIWLAEEKARMDSGSENSVLYLGDRQMIYVINHTQQTYSEVPCNAEGGIEQLMPEGTSTEDAAAMKQMMTSMMGSMEFKVTPTDETKKFRDWNARKYLVDMTMPMGTMHSETWASPEIEVDLQLFTAMSSAASAWMPGLTERMKEMGKIDGFPVYSQTTTSMMGQNASSTQELVEYARKPAPAEIFTLPAGYKEVDLMPRR